MSEHSEQTVTLAFLAQQQAKIIGELADQRADMAVLLAIVQRMDGTMHGLLGEVRDCMDKSGGLVIGFGN